MSKKDKPQVLLRGNGWRIIRAKDIYGYRLEGDLMTNGETTLEGSLPLSQDDVAKLFKSEGLEWRYENR
jgi:hypothetical protein